MEADPQADDENPEQNKKSVYDADFIFSHGNE
jgi:hypothetical protein